VHFFVAVNADQFSAESFGFSLGVYGQVHKYIAFIPKRQEKKGGFGGISGCMGW
jgi:hypothetical protein